MNLRLALTLFFRNQTLRVHTYVCTCILAHTLTHVTVIVVCPYLSQTRTEATAPLGLFTDTAPVPLLVRDCARVY